MILKTFADLWFDLNPSHCLQRKLLNYNTLEAQYIGEGRDPSAWPLPLTLIRECPQGDQPKPAGGHPSYSQGSCSLGPLVPYRLRAVEVGEAPGLLYYVCAS